MLKNNKAGVKIMIFMKVATFVIRCFMTSDEVVEHCFELGSTRAASSMILDEFWDILKFSKIHDCLTTFSIQKWFRSSRYTMDFHATKFKRKLRCVSKMSSTGFTRFDLCLEL